MFIALMMIAVAAPMAMAQTTLPSFTVVDLGPISLDDGKAPVRNPKEIFAPIDNAGMQKTLLLQHQITMLNALISWQTQISKLEETYMKSGVAFTAPKPPRDICEQVPANTVCGDAYADLAPEPEVMPTMASTMAAGNSVIPVMASSAPVATLPPPPSYTWADIQCKGSDCRAVIIDEAGGTRLSVVAGESVDDGVMVQSITPDSVTLTIRGERQQIDPSDKPARKMAGVATSPDSALSSTLAEAPPSAQAIDTINKAATNSAPPAAPIILDTGTPQESVDSVPTGLF